MITVFPPSLLFSQPLPHPLSALPPPTPPPFQERAASSVYQPVMANQVTVSLITSFPTKTG